MIKCTGLKCPMQVGKVDPATCKAAGTCKWATKPLTNADRIRAMTDEEMVSLLLHFPCPPNRHGEEDGRSYTECPTDETIHNCRECIRDWLKQEVEDGH